MGYLEISCLLSYRLYMERKKGVKRDSQGLGCSDEDGGGPKDGEAEMLFKLVWRRQADTQTRSLGWKA